MIENEQQPSVKQKIVETAGNSALVISTVAATLFAADMFLFDLKLRAQFEILNYIGNAWIPLAAVYAISYAIIDNLEKAKAVIKEESTLKKMETLKKIAPFAVVTLMLAAQIDVELTRIFLKMGTASLADLPIGLIAVVGAAALYEKTSKVNE